MQGRKRALRIARRLMVAASGCVALAVAAAACSSGGPGAPGRSSSGKVNLTYAMWTSPEQPGYQKSIDAFEKAHPNIHVTIESFAYNDYQSKLTTEFSAGGGPDVFWVNTSMLATWVKDGVMKDLTSKIKAARINLSQYIPALISMHEVNSKLYGLPKDWDTVAYFYNMNYFKQHHITIPSSLAWNPANGGTWLHFLKELTYDTSGHNALSPQFNPNSVATYATDSPNTMQYGFYPYLAGDGVRMINHQFAKAVVFNTPAGRHTFQFLTDLMYKYHVAVPGSDLGPDAATNSSEDQQLFAKGKVAMIESIPEKAKALLSEVKFPIGVLALPAGPDGKWTMMNGLIDAVNAHSPSQQAAWELEKWLFSPASEKILGEGGYTFPAISSLDSLYVAYWQKQGVNLQPFVTESHWNVVYWPVTPGFNKAQIDMENVLAPAYLSGTSVAQAVSAAAKQADDDLATAG